MSWATIFIGIVVIYALSAHNSLPSQKTAYKPPVKKKIANVQVKKPVPEMENPENDNTYLGSFSTAGMNDYQTIVSYIMDNYKKVPLADILEIAENVTRYSIENEIDPLLIAALMSVESSFNKKAISSTGAKGLGQLKSFNFKKYLIKDPFSIQQNARATSMMIKDLLLAWNGQVKYALASYYQGINAIKKQKKAGIPFRADTKKYFTKIIKRYEVLQRY